MRSIIAGIMGGGAFLLFFLFMELGLLLSVIAGAACFVAGYLIFTRSHRKKEYNFIFEGKLVDKVLLKKTMKAGRDAINELKYYRNKIEDEKVKKKVEKIIDVVERIFSNFRDDPSDIRKAQQFLNYYLNSALKVLNRYVEFSGKQTTSQDVASTLRKIEELLGTIYESFESQLAKLMDNDVMDVSSEIEVLEKTLKMEGLSK